MPRKPAQDAFLADALRMRKQLVKWRRLIHQHPELAYREARTASLVAEHLRSLGLEVRTGVGGTGVVGLIRGQRLAPAVLLRADMDALHIQEAADVPYRSRIDGVMHACRAYGRAAGHRDGSVEARRCHPGQGEVRFPAG